MSEWPHVLMLPSWYPSRLQPTNGNFIEQHIKAIASYCPVSVLFLESDPNLAKGEIEKVYAEPSGIPTWKVYYGKTDSRIPLLKDWIQFRQFLKAAWSGYHSLISSRGVPDLVHLHVLWKAGVFAYLLKKVKAIPYVVSEHSTLFVSGNQQDPGILARSLIKRIGKSADYILPVSKDLKGAMVKAGLKNHYEVVPNVVDPAVFYPGNKAPANPFTFLHLSNLRDDQKNFSGIIEAVEKLTKTRSDFMLKVITDNSDFGDFHDQIATKGLNDFFQFLPPMAPSQVADTMRNSHCFVMFSYYETFGIVLPEAFMCGLPAVFTDSGGVGSEVNSGYEGIQINPGDVDMLYNSMDYMIAHYLSYDTQKVSGKYARKFKPSTVGQTFYDVYQQVLSS